MKETEKIINQIQAWSQADDTDRASVVIMADLTTNGVDILSYGSKKDMSRLVTHWMNADKDTGQAIYAVACLYAHKHISAKERDRINAIASAFAGKDE